MSKSLSELRAEDPYNNVGRHCTIQIDEDNTKRSIFVTVIEYLGRYIDGSPLYRTVEGFDGNNEYNFSVIVPMSSMTNLY